jgi:hypothetical protein
MQSGEQKLQLYYFWKAMQGGEDVTSAATKSSIDAAVASGNINELLGYNDASLVLRI